MKDNNIEIIGIFLMAIIAILLAIGWKYIDEVSCKRRAIVIEKEYKFDWIVGCYYKEGDKWVKYNEEDAKAKKIYVKGVNDK